MYEKRIIFFKEITFRVVWVVTWTMLCSGRLAGHCYSF